MILTLPLTPPKAYQKPSGEGSAEGGEGQDPQLAPFCTKISKSLTCHELSGMTAPSKIGIFSFTL